MCYIVGWGIEIFKGLLMRILYEVFFLLVLYEQCNDLLLYSGVIQGDLICVGYKQGGVDICEGDSGGKFKRIREKGIYDEDFV